MTSLDSVLKSRDTTLLEKVHIVKAMVFPVVRYSCENWTIKEAEKQRKKKRERMPISIYLYRNSRWQ